MIDVIILGATGKMGRAFVQTALQQPTRFRLLAGSSRSAAGQNLVQALQLPFTAEVPCYADADALFAALPPKQADETRVVVDLTHPSCVYANAVAAIEAGCHLVIGATGLTQQGLDALDAKLKAADLRGGVFPNFSIGAVLLMQFAQQASRYFPHAELIELHHNQKADAPSGTSLRTAELMADAVGEAGFGSSNGEEHETLAGARGALTASGLRVHSVRLPGLVAHQEVLFGDAGQLLTLRHDSFDRCCFMPGIALCCERITALAAGLHQGMEHILALD